MPDFLDELQERELAAIDARHQRARLPDAVPPVARDCDRCGEAIDTRRLKAVPTAVRCTHCEEQHGLLMTRLGKR